MGQVRMSAADFLAIKRRIEVPEQRPPRLKQRRELLPENQVEAVVVDFLRAEQWFVTRQQAGRFKSLDGQRVIGTNGKGTPDWRAEKAAGNGLHYVFYFELKAPGKKPTPKQLEKLQERRAAGTPAEWFDCFDGGGQSAFLPWYQKRYTAPRFIK